MQVMRDEPPGEPRLHAVSNKVGSAGNGYRASREAGARHSALGGIHGIVLSTPRGRRRKRHRPSCRQAPQVGHGDDLEALPRKWSADSRARPR